MSLLENHHPGILLITLPPGFPPSWLPSLLVTLPPGYPPSWLLSLLVTLPPGYSPSWLLSLLVTLPPGYLPSWSPSVKPHLSNHFKIKDMGPVYQKRILCYSDSRIEEIAL
jgi:hypothetical protein